MRRHCQSVTMIVTTKATRMTSGIANSVSISGAAPSRRRKERRSPPGERRPFLISRLDLGEVVADVAEDVLDLAPQEDHGDDHGDGDDRDDEGVLDQALTVVLADEAVNAHRRPPFSRAASRRALPATTRKAGLTPLPSRWGHCAPGRGGPHC